MMRYLIALLLIVAFVIGCGCSSDIVAPAYGYTGDAADTWPCFFGTNNVLVENGYMSFYDQNASAFQAPRLIAADLLAGQWTPQRNAVGWNTAGTWNVTFIEDGGDLEIWESADNNWQDDAGGWGLTDEETTPTWLNVDVEARPEWVWWCGRYYDDPNNILAVGYFEVITPTNTYWDVVTDDCSAYFSIVLDKILCGYIHITGVTGGVVSWAASPPNGMNTGDTFIDNFGAGGDCPQIISDSTNSVYVFYTAGDVLIMCMTSVGKSPTDWFADNGAGVYTANSLTDYYHAAWCAFDDTVHVTLVDFDNVNPNSTYLIYMRRTPNGWSNAITLRTVDSTLMGDNDDLTWPQITIDARGAIFIHYIYHDNIGVAGDLCGYYLDTNDYDGFATPANWTGHTNIDQSGTGVEWVVAPDSIPIGGDM